MMLPGPPPKCPPMPSPGARGISSVPSTLATALAIFAVTVGTAILAFGIYVTIAASHPLAAFTVLEVWALIVTGAVAAFIFVFYNKRCGLLPPGQTQCIAGVVNDVVPAFSSWTDILFPFTAMHDRIDLVTRCQYWPFVTDGAKWVEASPRDGSPILQVFVYNDKVCKAGFGAWAGAALSGVIFSPAAAAAGTAIGCLIPFFCLLGLFVTFLIVLVATFIGQMIGGTLAHLTMKFPENFPLVPNGEYLAAQGTLVVDSDFKGAVIMWFADSTATHGISQDVQGRQIGFSHTDPDLNFNPDSCPLGPH